MLSLWKSKMSRYQDFTSLQVLVGSASDVHPTRLCIGPMHRGRRQLLLQLHRPGPSPQLRLVPGYKLVYNQKSLRGENLGFKSGCDILGLLNRLFALSANRQEG